MKELSVTLDLRADIRRGREPFGRIMETVATLQENEDLLLIVPFEPLPLFSLMARRGFSHEARQTDSGDWQVIFRRSAGASTRFEQLAAKDNSPSCDSVIEVDARGLEPPQPLVTILEAVARLPERAELRARTDRRPLHLYTHLEERGFAGETEEQADGSFVTTIRSR